MNWWIYWVAQVMFGVGCLYPGSVYGAARQRGTRTQSEAASKRTPEAVGAPGWHPEAGAPG